MPTRSAGLARPRPTRAALAAGAAAATLIAAPTLLAPPAAAQSESMLELDAAEVEQIHTDRRIREAALPNMVTITFVLGGSGFGNGEQEFEVTGTLVSEDGLVVTSSVLMGGLAARFGEQVTPRDLKIKLTGDDTDGLDATLLFRDSDLDLCWVQLDEPPAEPLGYLDLTESTEVEPGQDLFLLARIGEFFGGGWHMFSTPVAAVTDEPRSLYIPMGLPGQTIGLPVFSSSGQVVGLHVAQLPDAEDDAAGGPARPNTVMQGSGLAVLPAAAIVEATQRVLELAEPDDEADPE